MRSCPLSDSVYPCVVILVIPFLCLVVLASASRPFGPVVVSAKMRVNFYFIHPHNLFYSSACQTRFRIQSRQGWMDRVIVLRRTRQNGPMYKVLHLPASYHIHNHWTRHYHSRVIVLLYSRMYNNHNKILAKREGVVVMGGSCGCCFCPFGVLCMERWTPTFTTSRMSRTMLWDDGSAPSGDP